MHEQPSKSTSGSKPPENPDGSAEASSSDLYDKIVGKVQALDPVRVIKLGIACLRDPVESDAGSTTTCSDINPEHVMLIMRWAYQHYEPGKSTRVPSENDMRRLARDIHELESVVEKEKVPVREHRDWPRIDYHRRVLDDLWPEMVASISRQMILFRDKLEGSELDEEFKEKYRIAVSDLIRIYVLCCVYVSKGRDLSIKDLRDRWGRDNVDNFSKVFARDFERASDWMKEHSKQIMVRETPRQGAGLRRCGRMLRVVTTKIRGDFAKAASVREILCGVWRIPIELYNGMAAYARRVTAYQRSIWRELREPTPLVRIPFLCHDGNLVPYSLVLLDAGLRGNLYEMCEDLNVGFPGGCFGDAYEEYVQCLVEKLKLPFLSAKSLRDKMGGDANRADCVVCDGEKRIIIEAKSTTPPRKEMSEQDVIGAAGSAKRNILGGVLQIAHTARWLKTPDKRDVFGLVVTYGRYGHTWETIGERARGGVEREMKCLGNPVLTDQCFFLDIADFEYLVDEVCEEGKGFGDLLSALAQRQGQEESFVFKETFGRIVDREVLPTPKWLIDRKDAWMEELDPRRST